MARYKLELRENGVTTWIGDITEEQAVEIKRVLLINQPVSEPPAVAEVAAEAEASRQG